MGSRGGSRLSSRRSSPRVLRAHDLGSLVSIVALERVWTTGDPDLLDRLVGNLVSNAIRHNIAGGRIEVVTRSGGRTRLSLRRQHRAADPGRRDRASLPALPAALVPCPRSGRWARGWPRPGPGNCRRPRRGARRAGPARRRPQDRRRLPRVPPGTRRLGAEGRNAPRLTAQRALAGAASAALTVGAHLWISSSSRVVRPHTGVLRGR